LPGFAKSPLAPLYERGEHSIPTFSKPTCDRL